MLFYITIYIKEVKMNYFKVVTRWGKHGTRKSCIFDINM